MAAIAMILVVAFSFVVMLFVGVPVQTFAGFRAGGYKLSLKQLFVITAIVAVLCAAAGCAVRYLNESTDYEYSLEF
jgi:hypothetical protein